MSEPYYSGGGIDVHHGDCLDVLATLSDASVDAIVTDPPYGLGFMGREWDALPPGREWAEECLRVLKPGGHLLAFGGTRTWHRLAVAVEDAGFEVRDSLAWLYGSGFPKSLDVSKAIDKVAGAEREVVGVSPIVRTASSWQAEGGRPHGMVGRAEGARVDTAPATPDAERWQGWGTALKPAFEPIVVARKPLAGTVAANVLAHGTGALNIDGCRVGGNPGYSYPNGRGGSEPHHMQRGERNGVAAIPVESAAGRWPANVILDESQAAALDVQSGTLTSGKMLAGTRPKGERETYRQDAASGYETQRDTPGDSGGASRFFYTAKADASERVRVNGTAHPTVKPLSLMRWLVRLVTPPGGVVLEPFAGSGTTAEACLLEGFQCIAIEREGDYLPLIVQRLNRRRDPAAAVRAEGGDGGLFDLLGEESA